MNESCEIKMVRRSFIYALPFLVYGQVDGMDILCVREATRFAAAHCRSGKVRLSFWASGLEISIDIYLKRRPSMCLL